MLRSVLSVTPWQEFVQWWGNLDPANKTAILHLLFEAVEKDGATLVAVTHGDGRDMAQGLRRREGRYPWGRERRKLERRSGSARREPNVCSDPDWIVGASCANVRSWHNRDLQLRAFLRPDTAG